LQYIHNIVEYLGACQEALERSGSIAIMSPHNCKRKMSPHTGRMAGRDLVG